MKLTAMFVACLVALTMASAVPKDIDTDTTKRQGDMQPSLNEAVMGNLSYLLGWQLAGALLNHDELNTGCNAVSTLGHNNWVDIGFNPAFIADPLCTAAPMPASSVNSSFISTYTRDRSTQLFTTMLLAAFNNKVSAYAYICTNMNYDALDFFELDDGTVSAAVCSAAGEQVHPRPFGNGSGHNATAVTADLQSLSVLLGSLYAASADTTDQLHQLCSRAQQSVDRVTNTLGLHGDTVADTVCTTSNPMSAADARTMIMAWTTSVWVTIMENLSTSPDYHHWVCENVDVEGMNAGGLIGEGAKAQLCADA